jgi:uncharacterized short protein YbdD (DUF466 family)
MRIARNLVAAAQTFWKWLRVWSGDAAYERYCHAMRRKHSTGTLTPQEFYVQQLERRYSRPNRCC